MGEKIKKKIGREWNRNKYLYFLCLPFLIYYILFHYGPMSGLLMAFQDYSIVDGIWNSPFIGFENFIRFFQSQYFVRLVKNTLLLSIYNIAWGFPAPLILALLLNEVRNQRFKKAVQTITYLPHFISLVVVCGMLTQFLSRDGFITNILVHLGVMEPTNLLGEKQYFRTIYIASGIWQEIGWGSIIYLSALSGVDSQLYEAAQIDGAGKWKQLIHVTLPGIAPTIIIMFILKMGTLMNMGYEKTILLYNPATYETADIISSYIYRIGLLEQDWSYSTAIGLFNSVINLGLLLITNKIARKCGETSLW